MSIEPGAFGCPAFLCAYWGRNGLCFSAKNNPDKFPCGYIFELTKEEKAEVIEIFDNPKLKYSPALPKAFTEKGLYMLATILKSPKATNTTIAIVETFAKIRELSHTVAELSNTQDQFKQKA